MESNIPKNVDLSSFKNEWYQPGGRARRILWYLVEILFFLNPINVHSGLKVALLRLFGARVGRSVVIKPAVHIKYPWYLAIGDHTWIGERVWIDNLAEVRIGSHVCISQGAMLLTGNHDFTKVAFDLLVERIILEDGVWIGARSVVCPGVTCRSHSILTVQSVATRDMEAYGIYQGNPAVKVKERVIQL